MNILLVGEYSNLHNTLAAGLRALGHSVTLAADTDSWKGYPSDISLARNGTTPTATAAFLTRLMLALPRMRGYDIVQLINPVFLELTPRRLYPIYHYLLRHNRRVVMGAFGMDHYFVKASLDHHTYRYGDFYIGTHERHSPAINAFKREWLNGEKGRLNRHIAHTCHGIVSGLWEYAAAYQAHYHGTAPHRFIPMPARTEQIFSFQQRKMSAPPVVPTSTISSTENNRSGRATTNDISSAKNNRSGRATTSTISSAENNRSGRTTFFIGIQATRSAYKGTDVMLRALLALRERYPRQCHITMVQSIPFERYTQLMQGADVLLDQLYSYTPGMNALEAMSRGIAVVSGGEPENYDILGEQQLRPIINTQPTEESVYHALEKLILHPELLPQLKAQSIAYVQRHHHYIKVARQYEQFYNQLL